MIAKLRGKIEFLRDSFAVVVTDSDGSSATDSLDVRIIDDVPTARADVDSVTEDSGSGESPPTADGNVLTGLGGGDANACPRRGYDGGAGNDRPGGVFGVLGFGWAAIPVDWRGRANRGFRHGGFSSGRDRGNPGRDRRA